MAPPVAAPPAASASQPTSYQLRPFTVAGQIGFISGAGIRVGYSPHPIVGVEAHAGTLLLWQDYGVDLVVRPTATISNFTPTLRLGMGAMQNNLASLGGPPWIPAPRASVGVEWRADCGFFIGVSGGVATPISPPSGGIGATVKVLPDALLSIGGSFDL